MSGDRVAIVTGGANGIGRGCCVSLALAPEVGLVFALDVDVKAGEKLEAEHEKIKFIQADLSTAAGCEAGVRSALEQGGNKVVDYLVNNVGIQSRPGTGNSVALHLLEDDAWQKLLDVNLTSYFRVSKECLKNMLARDLPEQVPRGVICNISSVQGLQSQPGIPAYAASKGAIQSLTRQMAMEYADQGIRVFCVNPGTVRTPLVEELLAGAGPGVTCDSIRQKNLVRGGVGEPEMVGDVVSFLCSDKASFVSGECVNVDGGIMAKGSWNT